MTNNTKDDDIDKQIYELDVALIARRIRRAEEAFKNMNYNDDVDNTHDEDTNEAPTRRK